MFKDLVQGISFVSILLLSLLLQCFYQDPGLDDPGTFEYVVVISEDWLLAFSHSSFLSSPVKLCLRVHFKLYDSGLAYNLSIRPKGYLSRFRTQFPISLHIWKGRLRYRDIPAMLTFAS